MALIVFIIYIMVETYSKDDEEARPEDFTNCKTCSRELLEDEKIINARFVNEGLSAGRNIAIFPMCLTCNFDNLEH